MTSGSYGNSIGRWLIACAVILLFGGFAPVAMPAGHYGEVQVQAQPAHAEPQPEKHAHPTLIADTDAIIPGQSFKLGVLLKVDPQWHTYYKDPGEAGMPTRIEWTLPKGFTASELMWQKPHKFNDAGIVTYGYKDQTLIGSLIQVPADIKPGTHLNFSAKISWLTCKEICLPGDGTVELTLPVGSAAKPQHQADFAGLGFTGPVSTIGDDAQFSGDILNADLKVQGSAEAQLPLWAYLGLAFVGGFILNFMPCVLPCIAIKVLSFVKQAGEDPRHVFKLGAVFCAGIISSFLVLAGGVIAIQAAGQKIGWGFQFQFPLFLLVMAAIVLVFALSLFGLFYIHIGAGHAEIDRLAQKEGMVGTFGKGVLATTLSTPCSAPFLGTALGFAFAQPPAVILAIFFTIGLGMSSPYLVLTAHPAWMRFLPKPGAWMEKFKESMGFLLIATVVWLIWVLGQQVGLSAAMSAVGFLTCLSFAVWLVGRFTDLTSNSRRRAIVYSLAGAAIIGGYFVCLAPFPQLLSISAATATTGGSATPVVAPVVAVDPPGGGIDWQPFTANTLDDNLKAGKTVFVDFTADWCLTCKVNEATVLNTDSVKAKLQALKVVTLRADWTRQDPVISQLLRKFGRSGVPLYVIFPGARPTEPIVLPEVITQQLVLQALDRSGAP
jgi:thiol:disulfide interchange protein